MIVFYFILLDFILFYFNLLYFVLFTPGPKFFWSVMQNRTFLRYIEVIEPIARLAAGTTLHHETLEQYDGFFLSYLVIVHFAWVGRDR